MKIIPLQFGRRAKPIRLYIRKNQTRHLDESGSKCETKICLSSYCVFIFLTMFPKNNLNTLLCNTLELLIQFDRLLPIVNNFVLSPKQKVYLDTSVIVIFVDAIRG